MTIDLGNLSIDDIVRLITAVASAVAAIGTFINGRRITSVSSDLSDHVKKVDGRMDKADNERAKIAASVDAEKKEVDIIKPIHS